MVAHPAFRICARCRPFRHTAQRGWVRGKHTGLGPQRATPKQLSCSGQFISDFEFILADFRRVTTQPCAQDVVRDPTDCCHHRHDAGHSPDLHANPELVNRRSGKLAIASVDRSDTVETAEVLASISVASDPTLGEVGGRKLDAERLARRHELGKVYGVPLRWRVLTVFSMFQPYKRDTRRPRDVEFVLRDIGLTGNPYKHLVSSFNVDSHLVCCDLPEDCRLAPFS